MCSPGPSISIDQYCYRAAAGCYWPLCLLEHKLQDVLLTAAVATCRCRKTALVAGAEAAVVAVDGALAAVGDRGALPAKVVVDVGRGDEGGAPVGAVVATGAAGVPVVAVAGAPGVESSGEGSIVVVEVVEGRLVGRRSC